MTIYISLAFADSMVAPDAQLKRTPLSVEQVREILSNEKIVSGLNPSHVSTISSLESKHKIIVPVPEKAPMIKLGVGDKLIIMSARFPRRLNEGETWSQEDVDKTIFAFGVWEVVG